MRLTTLVLGFVLLLGMTCSGQDDKQLDQALERWERLFNKHDAAALALEYTEDVNALSYIPGKLVKGRAELERDRNEYFEKNPKVKTRITVVGRTVLAPGVVLEDGKWEESGHSEEGLPTSGQYTCILLKKGDRWLISHERGWPLVESDSIARSWLGYFAGKWRREQKMWSEDGGWSEPDVLDWSCNLSAGGTACISTGGSGVFGEWMVVEMLDGDGIFEAGSAASGSHWKIHFSNVTESELSGSIGGILPDGRAAKGKTKLIRVSDEVYEATVELSVEDGSKVRFMARNERK